MKTIKNYIFDFGDVFINLDKEATQRELLKLGMTSFSEEMILKNEMYEKGLINTPDFLTFYQKKFPNTIKNELKNAWNKILLDFPLYRLEFLEDFSKNNSCFLLSNINDMHLEFIKNKLGNEFYNRFYNCFEKVYYTHEIHLRKPDAIIFNYILEDANLTATSCFFVDDTLENIETAKKIGFHCWHIHPNKEDIIHLKNHLNK